MLLKADVLRGNMCGKPHSILGQEETDSIIGHPFCVNGKHDRFAATFPHACRCFAVGRQMNVLTVSWQKPFRSNAHQEPLDRAMIEHRWG